VVAVAVTAAAVVAADVAVTKLSRFVFHGAESLHGDSALWLPRLPGFCANRSDLQMKVRR